MLILSQNKEDLINVDQNCRIYTMHDEPIIRTDRCAIVGKYKDRNECKEVIALIYQAYASGNRVFMMPQSEVSE